MADEEVADREVSWPVLGIPVCGTLTAPKRGGSGAGIVLVAGSGPTDRDWCSPLLMGRNGSGKLLAEALAHRGFVTLRYDKLASGPHARENLPQFAGRASMQTHVDELAGAVRTIVAEGGAAKDRLGALTNSEGAIHAVNYQLQSPQPSFHAFVLTGAPGRSIGDVARSQLAEQGRALPNLSVLLGLYDHAIAEFLAGRPAKPDPDLPALPQQLIRSLEAPANLPFARELWSYRLPDFLPKVRAPGLVVIGKKDIQIDWKIDGNALEEAMTGRPGFSFVYPENANHVLKHEETPRGALTAAVGDRYNAPEAVLDREATGIIFGWLDRHLGRTG